MSNTRTVLLTPEIYVDQNIHEQLVDLMLEAIQGAREYINKSCAHLHFDFQIKTPPSALESIGATAVLGKLRVHVHTLTISIVIDSRRVKSRLKAYTIPAGSFLSPLPSVRF